MCFNFCVLKVKEYFFFYFFLNQQKFKIKKKLNGLKLKKTYGLLFFCERTNANKKSKNTTELF